MNIRDFCIAMLNDLPISPVGKSHVESAAQYIDRQIGGAWCPLRGLNVIPAGREVPVVGAIDGQRFYNWIIDRFFPAYFDPERYGLFEQFKKQALEGKYMRKLKRVLVNQGHGFGEQLAYNLLSRTGVFAWSNNYIRIKNLRVGETTLVHAIRMAANLAGLQIAKSSMRSIGMLAGKAYTVRVQCRPSVANEVRHGLNILQSLSQGIVLNYTSVTRLGYTTLDIQWKNKTSAAGMKEALVTLPGEQIAQAPVLIQPTDEYNIELLNSLNDRIRSLEALNTQLVDKNIELSKEISKNADTILKNKENIDTLKQMKELLNGNA